MDADKLSNEIDVVEEQVFKLDIITSFEYRGWALYKCEYTCSIENVENIKDIVSSGRAKDDIEYDVPYVLLPLVDNDADWQIIHKLTNEILLEGRGPYFIDLLEGEDEKGKWIETVGIYLIDSIVINPPFIHLVIDRRMSFTKTSDRKLGDGIELHITELYKIRKQLMVAIRG